MARENQRVSRAAVVSRRWSLNFAKRTGAGQRVRCWKAWLPRALFLLLDTREVQRLNSRIRVHREQLHEMETRLKDIRKGKGGMVRFVSRAYRDDTSLRSIQWGGAWL